MKVSHKTRRGRKRNPVPHKPHRNAQAVRDPLKRAKRVARERRLAELAEAA